MTLLPSAPFQAASNADGTPRGVALVPAPSPTLALRLPAKLLRERPCNTAVRDAYLQAGVSPWLADLLGRRLDHFVEWASILAPKLGDVPDPSGIPSMDQAVARIVAAIQKGERIALACDHDMDGTASAAVLWSALVDLFGVPAEQVRVFTSHRLTEGYGIGEGVVARIEGFGADLVISADKGSSDGPRIDMLAAKGIDVVITDHHVIPVEGPPASALAVVNPGRQGSTYDPHVCGAGVAFLVMAKVRSALLEHGLRSHLSSLTGLLDYVAVATIADCVSLSPGVSSINRTFIRRGLELVRAQGRPCWKVFAREQTDEIDAETIAFGLVPAIASAGRLDWAEMGFRFLIARTEAEASACWEALQRENSERKAIEKALRERAFLQASQMDGPAIVLFFQDGHAGVHGITASRVVEAFGRPCAIFAPKGQGARATPSAPASTSQEIASGSFRSVPGIDVQRALSQLALAHPGLFLAYGGHPAAAGATLRTSDLDFFTQAFSQAIAEQTAGAEAGRPVVWTDGELEDALHSLATLEGLQSIGPFGRGFEAPVYSGGFLVVAFHALTNGRHGRLRLQRNGMEIEAIWFQIEDALPRPPSPGDRLEVAYRLRRRQYRGQESLQAMVVAGSYQ
ncbi:MAG: single-stranded-DNA-specific exonuclease RecJ [Acidobacteriaceae bacterium]